MKTIAILNGPNLSELGKRDTAIYGMQSLLDIQKTLLNKAKQIGVQLIFEQSNNEGIMIDYLLEWSKQAIHGVILNPDAFAHTSIALRDTVACVNYPVVEIHISNIYARESFRHHSWLSAVCVGVICGLGAKGYELGLEYLSTQ